MSKPNVLIEDWLPVATIGAESMRERGASSALPPLYFLHVWFARRPLTASRATILASLLPAYSDEWPQELKKKFPSEKDYHNWFLRLIGIHGDPVAAKKLLNWARSTGVTKHLNAYGYRRAFTSLPDETDLNLMRNLLKSTWGTDEVSVLDPTAGGGTIPFESLRFGFETYANELNPVASVILKATLDFPAKFKTALKEDILKYGKKIGVLARSKLQRFFPDPPDGVMDAYIWARTVKCPTTGKPVPLSPNWWLQKKGEPIAVRMIAKPEWDECRFEIIKCSRVEQSNPDKGTISRGVAVSPWTGETVSSDYIQKEAQSGNMGQQLYCVRVKTAEGYEFRPPSTADLQSVQYAEKELESKLPLWKTKGLVPVEEIPLGYTTAQPRRFGMYEWMDMFTPRQLLALGTYVETLNEVMVDARKELSKEMADAVQTYMAFAIDKSCDRNSRMARWISQRSVMAGTFDSHDYRFRWSHAEMAIIVEGKGFDWAVNQIADSYKGIAELACPSQHSLSRTAATKSARRQLLLCTGDNYTCAC